MSARFAKRMIGVQPSAIRDVLKYGADPHVISFAGGYPDASLFPLTELKGIFERLLAEEGPRALQYTVSDGTPDLRRQIAERMTRHGTPTAMDDVLVVQGAQQGMDLTGKLMLDEGDVVVTEDPTFLGAMIAFAPFQPRYAPVAMDQDGMDVDAIERTLAANPRAKFIYTMPDFHNPTGTTMSLPRRRRLIELANRFDVVVLEDTPYRDLRYEGDHVPTLKSLDTEGRVIHLGSFSKIVAPGLRLGWMVASEGLVDQLGLLKLAADTQTSTLNMAATSAYLRDYDIEAHIADVIKVYRDKRDVLLDVLSAELPEGAGFTAPSGGLFVWLTLPDGFDADTFLKTVALPQERVAFVPGRPFFPTSQRPHHARLGFAGVPMDQLADGATRLSRAMRVALSGR